MEVVSQAGQALRDLVSSMMTLERRPVAEVSYRKSVIEREVSSQKQLASKLSSLRRMAQDFSSRGALSPLRGFSVTGLESSPVRATASSSALSGTHQLQVHALAQSHSIASQPLSAAGSSLTELPKLDGETASFSIDQGGDGPAVFEVSLKPGMTNGEVVRAIAEAINRGDSDLSASVVQTSPTESRLLIQTRTSGQDARIRSISDVDGNLMSALGLAGGEVDGLHHSTVQTPQDAELTLDGLAVRGSSNRLENVLSGVTLNIDAVTEGIVEFEVGRDVDGVTANVEEFLESYNSSLDEIIGLTRAADDSGQNRGVLASSTAFRSLRFRLRRELTDPVSRNGQLVSLEQIGISASRDGKLSIDQKTFAEALQSNPTLVEDLFSGEGGVASRLEGLLDGYARTGGILDQQVAASNRRVDLYTRRITSLETGLAKREEHLLAELASLQAAIGTLSAQGSYLANLFAS